MDFYMVVILDEGDMFFNDPEFFDTKEQAVTYVENHKHILEWEGHD